MRFIVLVMVLSALAWALASCGGSDAQEISKAEFIRQADRSCTRAGDQGQAELTAYLKQHEISGSKTPSPKQVEEIGTEILEPLLKRQLREMRALGLPEQDRRSLTGFLRGLDDAIEKLEKEPVLAGSPLSLLARADRFAVEYGFKVCGNR